MGVKVCSKCKQSPPEGFSKVRSRKDGLNPWCRPCTREHVKAWRRRNREYVLAYMRKQNAAWRKRNPARERAKNQRRYDRLASAPGGTFDPKRDDYMQRVAYFDGKCAYCEAPFEQLDHSIPLSRGGTNFASNIRPICKGCNRSKYTKTPAEFVAWRARNMPVHER